MDKDNKIVIGAIIILLVCLIVFNSGITGQAWSPFRFFRGSTPSVAPTPSAPIITPPAPTLPRPGISPIARVRHLFVKIVMVVLIFM